MEEDINLAAPNQPSSNEPTEKADDNTLKYEFKNYVERDYSCQEYILTIFLKGHL